MNAAIVPKLRFNGQYWAQSVYPYQRNKGQIQSAINSDSEKFISYFVFAPINEDRMAALAMETWEITERQTVTAINLLNAPRNFGIYRIVTVVEWLIAYKKISYNEENNRTCAWFPLRLRILKIDFKINFKLWN